jgi:hypothetical protein
MQSARNCGAAAAGCPAMRTNGKGAAHGQPPHPRLRHRNHVGRTALSPTRIVALGVRAFSTVEEPKTGAPPNAHRHKVMTKALQQNWGSRISWLIVYCASHQCAQPLEFAEMAVSVRPTAAVQATAKLGQREAAPPPGNRHSGSDVVGWQSICVQRSHS